MRVGVVGYGSIGQRHAINLATLGHQVLVYDPASRRDVSFERDIYETCDAVVIATPSWVHTGCIRACAERGRHMMVEKPISTSDRGLQELLDSAKQNGAVVMVGNNLRFHSCVQRTKLWIDAGDIGKPLWALFICAAESAKAPYLSDGVILNTGAHEVDMALHLLGPARVLTATAHLRLRPGTADGDVNVLGNCDDIADFVLEHLNGCRSVFHLDFVTPKEIRGFRVVGDSGDVYCDLPGRSFAGRFADAKLPGIYHTQYPPILGSYDTDYMDEMRAFIDRIEGKDVPGATGEDGLATLQVLLDVRRKAGLV